MPLRFDVEEYLGTNADHSCSDEYCYYCLKDGNYTVDISMNEMVDIWVKYTDKYNWYSGTDYTPQELKTLLNKRLPTLKRWRQKEMTQHVHYEAVNGVRTYIDQNLFHELDPEQLAEMVHLSFFHFRKVFRNVTGENIGTYIQRLRLEYIAHLLIATGQSIEEIGMQTNYQTKFSLAKAFKKHFGISMSAYREKYKSVNAKQEPDSMPEAKIKRINTLKAVCIEVGDTFRDKYAYTTIWKQLLHYKAVHLQNGPGNRFVSIILGLHRWNNGGSISGFLLKGVSIPKGNYYFGKFPEGCTLFSGIKAVILIYQNFIRRSIINGFLTVCIIRNVR